MTIFESIDEDLYYARNSVNTNPTDGQKKAGNYKKGHVTINGYKISIENPKGSVRRGKDRNGHEWSITMAHDYGYFVKKTKGKDGDPIDVFIGDDLESEKIFVVDQKVGGKFDESKVMFCFDSEEKAKQGYLDCYEENWKGFWKITPVSQETFRKWLYDGYRQRKPFFQYVEIIKSNKKEKENMKKKQIRLTEGDLRRIVKESVNRVLRESSDDIRRNGWQDKLEQIARLAMEMAELAKDESPNGFGERRLLQTADRIVNICAKWGAAPDYKPYFINNY